jgi:hypothetical protein
MPRTAFPSGRKILLLALAVVIGGAWWWTRPPRAPEYRGLSLWTWLAHHGATLPSNGERPTIQAFGPAGVKWLAYTVEHGRLAYTGTGPCLFDHAPFWLRERLPEKWGGFIGVAPEGERVLAADALALLGPAAAPAIPALARNLKGADEELIRASASALIAIGAAAAPAIRDSLEHGSPIARIALIREMKSWKGWTDPAVSRGEIVRIIAALVQNCRNPDAEFRFLAVNTCGFLPRLRPGDPIFEPLTSELVRLRSDPDPRVRENAVDRAQSMDFPPP